MPPQVMRRMTWPLALLSLALAGAVPLPTRAAAPQGSPGTAVSPDLYSGLKWRNIGPFHGGRVASVTGVIGSQPGTFYIGTPLGGIWKTTSAGVTWYPIFDQVTGVDSVGAIQVAPSDPDIIYAGSGDSVGGSDGDGMYKSTDAGKTWTHIGLEDDARASTRWWSIRRIPISSSSRRPETPPTRAAACIARRTAAGRGRTC